jgi:glycosyltransferase involved in cell wall biosynthesis
VAQIVTRFIAGAGGVALRGALTLDPARYDVTIITGEGGKLAEAAEDAGMRVVLEPSLVPSISQLDDLVALQRLTRLCRTAKFDVVHTHSAKAGAIGRLAAHRAGVPVIVHTYHGFPFHQFQDRVHHAAYTAIERRLERITDAVLAIGSGVATEAIARGLARPTAIRTVPPIVDGHTVVRSATTRTTARDELGLQGDVEVIGTVGRIDYQKAPEHLVAALARSTHRNAILVWIGSGPLLQQVRRMALEQGVLSRVRFLGERTDVAALLPAFDVFAMSSRYEGLPCALVEAMRCGVPVVATAVNSVPDLVVPGESGILVPPARPDLLAAAIDRLLEDRSAAERMVARGRALAGEPYQAECLAAVLDDVYTAGLQHSAGVAA